MSFSKCICDVWLRNWNCFLFQSNRSCFGYVGIFTGTELFFGQMFPTGGGSVMNQEQMMHPQLIWHHQIPLLLGKEVKQVSVTWWININYFHFKSGLSWCVGRPYPCFGCPGIGWKCWWGNASLWIFKACSYKGNSFVNCCELTVNINFLSSFFLSPCLSLECGLIL